MKLGDVVKQVNGNYKASNAERTGFLKELWETLDQVVKVRDENQCQILSYNVEPGVPPLGSVYYRWSVNYFFYNPQLLRLVFFHCHERSTTEGIDSDGEHEDDESELEYYDDDGNVQRKPRTSTVSPMPGDASRSEIQSSIGRSSSPAQSAAVSEGSYVFEKYDDDDDGQEDQESEN